jgi:simple sugar transport system permease protein
MMNRKGIFSFLSSVVALIVGLLIGLVILLISNSDAAFGAFTTIVTHGFSDLRVLGNVLSGATPIILTGLSVMFAFKTGLFNIGATGQFTLGAFLVIIITRELTILPPMLRMITAIVAATAAGALWGAIPGLLKAFRNVHEVITCIMTNYIAMFLVTFLVDSFVFETAWARSYPAAPEARLPTAGLDSIFATARPSTIDIGIIIAILAAILVFIILDKTVFGYELKASGFNSDAAKYAGINQNRNIVAAMAISGALAGLGGGVAYLGVQGLRLEIVNALLQDGFVGISVAFLGMNHPIGVVFAGLLISHLTTGGAQIQAAGFAVEIVNIVIAIIIYFCAFVLIIKTFLGQISDKLFRRSKDEGEQAL